MRATFLKASIRFERASFTDHARLAFAVENGCDLAMVATQPGSGSQRNVERQGFRVVYTRTKFLKQ
ncbi:MAG TPA: hypothetical protein VLU47_04145 [Blastocatellia bacterium]|nr:hypothetical protein [Blastocatellia bacterium]